MPEAAYGLGAGVGLLRRGAQRVEAADEQVELRSEALLQVPHRRNDLRANSGKISRFFVLFALKNANKPSLRFSDARLVVEYLSDITSPCSVYLNLFFIVPLGCDRIEL